MTCNLACRFTLTNSFFAFSYMIVVTVWFNNSAVWGTVQRIVLFGFDLVVFRYIRVYSVLTVFVGIFSKCNFSLAIGLLFVFRQSRYCNFIERFKFSKIRIKFFLVVIHYKTFLFVGTWMPLCDTKQNSARYRRNRFEKAAKPFPVKNLSNHHIIKTQKLSQFTLYINEFYLINTFEYCNTYIISSEFYTVRSRPALSRFY